MLPFKAQASLLTLFTVFRMIRSTGSVVKESNTSYPCCTPFEIQDKEHCTYSVHISGEVIATINGVYKQCTYPCQKNGDKLEIHDCANFTLDMACHVEGYTVEERSNYKGQSCQLFTLNQASLQPQGCVGLLLVALLITRFLGIC